MVGVVKEEVLEEETGGADLEEVVIGEAGEEIEEEGADLEAEEDTETIIVIC